ncbi:MAG: uracil-DNA glycosylase [Nitrospirae bacterium]|nr:uracil-DNA glycosylase [Nitrospirota bacterium]
MLEEIKKALEFYQELGFEYLPFKAVTSNELRVTSKATNYEPKSSLITEPTLSRRFGTKGHSSHVKESSLKSLRETIGDCKRCKLSDGRTNIVFGEGNPNTEIMFIGEGPGMEEDQQARPFVGEAGKILTSLINKMGLKREDVYIANIVKCRPPMNRPPQDDEINACKPFVEEQIKIINPKIIMTLGKTAVHTLLNIKTPISKLRGSFHEYMNIPVMPTFHPAYFLRNPKDKWLTWSDAQKVIEALNK